MVRAAYACLKNRAEAEDVAQEVFLIPSGKALRRTGRGPPEGMAAEGHGQQMQEPAQKRLVPGSRNELPESLTALDRREDEVLAAVFSQEEKYRLPLHLHYYESYFIREIVRILVLPAATVGTRLSRGRTLIK